MGSGQANTGILDSEDTSSQSLPETLVSSALKHRAIAPLVDSSLKEAGVTDLTAQVNGGLGLRQAQPEQVPSQPEQPAQYENS